VFAFSSPPAEASKQKTPAGRLSVRVFHKGASITARRELVAMVADGFCQQATAWLLRGKGGRLWGVFGPHLPPVSMPCELVRETAGLEIRPIGLRHEAAAEDAGRGG
jgi:hypothetical protein